MNKNISKLKQNEQGAVAIIVSVLMILIISLLVLAMAQNSNREQRQSLDRQLSDQAFYNAESGINDTANYLYANPNALIDKKDCTASMGTINIPNNVDANGNQYTCILYDKAPQAIQYDNLGVSTPKVVTLQSTNAAGASTNMASITIAWDDSADRNGSVSGSCNFPTGGSPQLPQSCSYGGVRAEIISPAESRDALRDRSFISYLLPNENTAEDVSVTNPESGFYKGIIRTAKCNGPAGQRRCSITISDLNRSNLFLTLRSLYRPVNVSVSGKDSAGNALRFKDSQIVIDSTGKAADVLRRVQVRIPAGSQYDYPGFGLQTKDSICKLLNVTKDGANGTVATDNSSVCPLD